MHLPYAKILALYAEWWHQGKETGATPGRRYPFRNISSLKEQCGEFSMKIKEQKLPNLGLDSKNWL